MAKVTVLLEKWMVAETESREQVQSDVTIESWTELSPEVTLMCLSSSLVKRYNHRMYLFHTGCLNIILYM